MTESVQSRSQSCLGAIGCNENTSSQLFSWFAVIGQRTTNKTLKLYIKRICILAQHSNPILLAAALLCCYYAENVIQLS